ncbi:MAG: DUF4166 domain-containing protein [Gammaproteobacteria bacterium]|nr:DUF4166 domain-containing protein [Gammaproteobacteria bacterium]
MRILILGGYGTFGGRLAQLLADEPRLTLFIAGRSAQKAKTFCNSLPSGAHKIALSFERDGDIDRQLAAIKPDVVVDATGPFQSYGDHPYRVVQACLALKIHYLDLADGSDFVKGISQFDTAAKTRNVYVLSGVSSFPVLTAAVVRRLSHDMIRVTAIKSGIAPSPYAGVGLNVIRAIASYSGQPVTLVRGGRKARGYALTETMRYTIAPPGRLPLRNIRFSLVDVPDLQTLPDLWPELDSIWMGAGPVPEILQRMLNGLAWLVRLKLLPSLTPFASLFYRVINVVRWGEHRGGMFVSVEGVDRGGNRVERSWHLLAEGNDGPLIPSMAIEAIIRRSLAGTAPVSGARPATKELELEDYEALFSRRTIYPGQREQRLGAQRLPLYQRALGDAWASLPGPIRLMHQCTDGLEAEGVATVERGRGAFSRLVGALIGFPNDGQNVPARVIFECKKGGEVWRRTFAGKSFFSLQTEGTGRSERLICEKFGPFSFGLALVVEANRLNLVVRRWSVFGFPLPPALAPTGRSYEFVENGRFNFHVEIAHVWTGLIVRYRGWLVPSAQATAAAESVHVK